MLETNKKEIFQKSQKTRGGFTLMELIFVIIIIAVLAAITIPKIMNNSDKTKIASMIGSDVKSLYQASTEWKQSSTNSDGTYANITNAEIEAYLPANMIYDSANGYIKSSGLNGGVHYTVLSDKISTNGDSIKVYVDLSTASKNNNWNTNIKKYAEIKTMDLLVRDSSSAATAISTKDATGIGSANANFDTGGTSEDALAGVRQITL